MYLTLITRITGLVTMARNVPNIVAAAAVTVVVMGRLLVTAAPVAPVIMSDLDGNITCVSLNDGIMCNGTKYTKPEPPLTYTDMWFWIFLGIYVGLVLFAGLMSGLTLGMLSLDMMTLHVLQEAGTPSEKKYATRLIPVVKRHHLLLVTLLLANAVAVESMPLCLDRISDPITAIVVSVTAVLLFGEVFPQALCSRFGLAIGATMVPLVYVLMGILFIIAWPLSKLLDCLLGVEHSTFFRRAELKALVGLHGPDSNQGNAPPEDKPLSMDEVLIIKGALEMRDKTATDAMVPLESVFMLDINARLDRQTMKEVLQASHSRVPVFDTRRDNVLGVLLIKTLIMLDPDDAVPVSKLLHNPCCSRVVSYVWENQPLFDILNEFQTGKSHLTFVLKRVDDDEREDSSLLINRPVGTELIGIMTLEDIIEELLQEEIIDETDVFIDVHKRVRVARARARLFQRSNSATPHGPTPASTPKSSTTPVTTRRKGRKQRQRLTAPDETIESTQDIQKSDSMQAESPDTPLLQN